MADKLYLERVIACDTDVLNTTNRLLQQLSSKDYKVGEVELNTVLGNHNSFFFFVMVGNSRVGMVTVSINDKPTGRCAVIDDVVIDGIFRGLGYGKLLIEAVVEFAKSYGVGLLFLTSNPTRIAANRLYRSCGFEQKQTNVFTMKL